MKSKSMVIFITILLIVACLSYSAMFGITIGNLSIAPFTEELDLGLDLEGGIYVVLEAQTDATGAELDDKMKETKVIVENRVNGIGVSEPYITIENGNRLRVELAGMSDPQEAMNLIGRTALLEFVDPDGNVVVTGKNVESAEVVTQKDQFGVNQLAVSLKFDDEGSKLFKDATQKLMDKKAADINADTRVAITLDGIVQSAPYVQSVISDGKCVIEGRYTVEEASQLASVIRAGALPVEMKELEVRVIGPTLGLESFDKSVKAGIIGVICIFIFMIIFYRLPGIVACIALTIYILLEIGIMIALNAKLTLPGIAGMVLSIGMAVDANVVIFERIKEELRVGKTLRVAVKAGFQSAFSAIMDANVTTLIAGVVLLQFGSGPIKGFAVTLIIGIIVSLITAVVITRLLLNLIVNMNIVKSNKYFGA